MLITKNENLKNTKILLNNITIGHSKTIRILGTIFNEQPKLERPFGKWQ